MGAIGNHVDVLVHADGLFVPTKSPLLCHCCPGIHRQHRSQGCGGEPEGLTLKLRSLGHIPCLPTFTPSCTVAVHLCPVEKASLYLEISGLTWKCGVKSHTRAGT